MQQYIRQRGEFPDRQVAIGPRHRDDVLQDPVPVAFRNTGSQGRVESGPTLADQVDKVVQPFGFDHRPLLLTDDQHGTNLELRFADCNPFADRRSTRS